MSSCLVYVSLLRTFGFEHVPLPQNIVQLVRPTTNNYFLLLIVRIVPALVFLLISAPLFLYPKPIILFKTGVFKHLRETPYPYTGNHVGW